MSKTVLFNTFAIEDMQMRDYFAAKAMSALMLGLMQNIKGKEIRYDTVSEMAYNLADAMMEAREAK